jgi:hypothetical protein
VDEEAELNAAYYIGRLLPVLMADCNCLLPSGFIVQQDGAPVHTASVTHDLLQQNCLRFIEEDQWPRNSPDLNPSDYDVSWGPCLQKYHELQPSQNTIAELKVGLHLIWDNSLQKSMGKSVMNFIRDWQMHACQW